VIREPTCEHQTGKPERERERDRSRELAMRGLGRGSRGRGDLRVGGGGGGRGRVRGRGRFGGVGRGWKETGVETDMQRPNDDSSVRRVGRSRVWRSSEDALEASFGFHIFSEGEPRLGWLLNMASVSFSITLFLPSLSL
jgi:DNA polymerase epsilon subunit 1